MGMDRDLLETETGPPRAHAPGANDANETGPAPEPTSEYRDIEIEPRKPPVRVRFNPPLQYDGEEYRELIFDFDAMTGKDFIRAEREFYRHYKPVDKNEIVLPEMRHLYHEIILSHRANVSYLLIQKLERRYYVPLRTEALKACGSSSEEEEKKV